MAEGERRIDMKLVAEINGIKYNVVDGATFSEQWNETLDSGAIIIDQVEMIEGLKPFDDVYITNSDYEENPLFYKHLLVDSFTEEMLLTTKGLFKYKIDLCSEAKRLEKIILPNISISQPIDKGYRKRSIWFYLDNLARHYFPKIRVVDDESVKTWKYESRYDYADGVKAKFDSIDAPEISLTNPSLRDLVTQLMLVADCIPVVHDDKIGFIDISKPEGTFQFDGDARKSINYIYSSMSSESYSTLARREYSQAISQENNATVVEYIGFRNSDSALLTLNGLRLETRFPIYKINKIRMCYYKTATMTNGDISRFMCKQDITDFVLESTKRNSLSNDWKEMIKLNDSSPLSDFAKYTYNTVYYNIGGKTIDGWGEIFNFTTDYFWNQSKTSTRIENMLYIFDNRYPYGMGNTSEIAKYSPGQVVESVSKIAIYGLSSSYKDLVFEVEYTPLYSGALVHSKKGTIDDLETADNCSSALTILERDGVAERSKMDRLSNKVYSIQARYGSDSDRIGFGHEIGNEIEGTDVLVYSSEIQIYNNVVLANYEGCPKYALKNYFTSVWAKHRTYNLMQYGEAVRRAENIKRYALISSKEALFDGFDNMFWKYALYQFKMTEIPERIGGWHNDLEINTAWFEHSNGLIAMSDVFSFSSGYSMCVSIEMYDNSTGGVYYVLPEGEDVICYPDLLIESSKKTGFSNMHFSGTTPISLFSNLTNRKYKGTLQDWAISTSDVNDSFEKDLSIGFCHLPNDAYSVDAEEYDSVNDPTLDIYENILFKLPKGDINEISAYAESINGHDIDGICKDNKEYINATMQLEYMSIDEDVLISEWFAKLNSLIFKGRKLEQSGSIVERAALGICTVYWYSRTLNATTTPRFVVKSELIDFSDSTYRGKTVYMTSKDAESDFYYNTSRSERTTYRMISVSVSGSGTITALVKVDTWRIDQDNPEYGYSQHVLDGKFETVLTAVNSTDISNYYFRCGITPSSWIPNTITEADGYYDKDNGFFPDESQDVSGLEGNSYKAQSFFSTTEQYYPIQEEEYSQNMFISTSIEEVDDSFLNVNPKYTGSSIFPKGTLHQSIKISDVIKIMNDDYTDNIRYIQIDTDLGVPNAESKKSISVWYKDNSDSLHFVFGINTKLNQGKKNVYASIMTKRDKKVYSKDGHRKIVGEIRNYESVNGMLPSLKYD